jgi:hypothetical protein
MPWKDANVMELRIQFITDWLKRTHTVSFRMKAGRSSMATEDGISGRP